jgi:hypothetical protein
MRAVLRAGTFFGLGVLALLALLEAALRLLPTMSGLRPNPATESWPLRSYEASRPYEYSNGWAMLNAHRGMTNNYGHVAPQNFSPGSRPLIVVGDSFVESLMNDYGDTLQGILGSRLGAGRPVYGLGVSALSASDYIVLARLARDEFAPTAAVFLIIDGDMVESFVRRAGGYHLERRGAELELEYGPLSPNAGMEWVRRHLGDSALYDYVRGNLKFSPGDVLHALRSRHSVSASAPSPAEPSPAAPSVEGRQVAEWFLRELPRATGIAPECTVLLLDTDRYALYDPSDASTPKDAPEVRRLLIERGSELGFKMIDLGPLFATEYARTQLKLDYWPVDRHWNRRAHTVAADAVMNALFPGGAPTPCMPGGESR